MMKFLALKPKLSSMNIVDLGLQGSVEIESEWDEVKFLVKVNSACEG